MANATLPPYKGHPAAEVQAFEHGTDGDTMSPEMVWECLVTHDDLTSATQTITLTFADPEDGDFETTFFDENDDEIDTVTTARVANVPDTAADMATQHTADIDALIGTTLADYVSEVRVDGVVVTVDVVAGVRIRVETSAPGSASLTADHILALNLNDLQPNDAYPANSLRGESPVLRVLEAFPAGTVATLDDGGIDATDVLALSAVDATGWVGDTGTTVGDAHKVELDWEPTLSFHFADDPFPTTGEVKVQVTHSPLPE